MSEIITSHKPGLLSRAWHSQRARVLGIVFIVLILAGVWLTWGLFTQKFSSFDEVKLEAARTGLQLPERADIKVRGVLVGEVLDQKPTENGAVLTLGIKPDQIDTIPSHVTGAILPKTLFGQKYVSLVPPKGEVGTASDHLQPGTTISETKVAIEVQKVLNNIYPLLRSIQPADLNNTLNAMATALEGRGNKLGETIETLDGYLKKINPQIPLLVDDLDKAAKVSDVYRKALPQISQIIRDSIDVTHVFETHEGKITQLTKDVSAFSRTTNRFLSANEGNLTQLGPVLQPTVSLLARYSPELPCMITGVKNVTPRLSQAFRNYTLHIDLEILPKQPRAYNTGDKPKVGVTGGPNCRSLPNPIGSQTNPIGSKGSPIKYPVFNDGVQHPTGKMRASYQGNGASYAGTPEESALLKSLMAPELRTSSRDVPDLGPLLLGPLTRGAKVSIR